MDTPFQFLGALSPERKTLGLRSNKRGARGGWGRVNGEREEYGESWRRNKIQERHFKVQEIGMKIFLWDFS
jgi:hypothetical protein